MDRDRNNTKRLAYMKKAKAFFNKKRKEKEDRLGRELTKEERKENRKKNRKMAGRVAMFATVFALGMVGGAEGMHLLDSGNSVKVVEDNSTKNGRKLFVDGLHIEEDELETIKTLKQDVHEKVNQLEGKPEQVLTYIKELYANEYNQKEGTDITSNDISIDRRMMPERGMADKEGKINTLIENRKEEIGRNMEMEITIDNKKCHDKIKIPYTRFENTYSKDHVYSPGAVRLANSLVVMDMGLDWIDEEAKQGASKEGFEHAIIEYRKCQMNDIAIGYDISDDEGFNSSIAKKEGDKMMDYRGEDANGVFDER